MHPHDAGAPVDLTGPVLGGALLVLLAGYLAAIAVSRRRGRPWPAWRTACAEAGVGVAAVAVAPVAAVGGFVAHMWAHLLLGMLAPILLVLAAPVTLALRALPAARARRLSRFLASRPIRVLTHPAVAGTLDAGGLWLLYGTGLYAAMHHDPGLHLLVHAHVLAAGWLFTASVLRVDPDPHPVGHRTRALVLLAFLTLHAILAKHLYAHPPTGVPEAQAQAGAQLMYYGGDYIDVALLVLFCLDWYRRTAPTRASAPAAHPA
ncbi:cytochrome c oxidase assembly protein [Agilicoccus flavus]|uniref:cytochrome c oxidase assembly protein n=1 Tax=Agilicoccus flavus TaxID=2775968 RepID=UPI001CF655EE|nr:cytochrome c oxidase assembly protein [Agilicoccus flavus]